MVSLELTGVSGLTRQAGTLEATEQETWLKACEVSALFVQAGLFRVPRSTLRRWTLSGRISSVRLAGGHRRYPESEARALIAAAKAETAEAVA